jgi:hypothetical protein
MRLFCIKEARKIRDPNLPKNPRPKDAKSVNQPPFSTLDENSLASLGLAYFPQFTICTEFGQLTLQSGEAYLAVT